MADTYPGVQETQWDRARVMVRASGLQVLGMPTAVCTLVPWYIYPLAGYEQIEWSCAASPLDALAVCSRPRLLPCCCDHHGLIAAHPENKCHRCETLAQHPELIWIKTVHVLACVIKILRR